MIVLSKHLSKIIPLVLIVISVLTVLIWFKDKSFLATGEDGLILYNPSRVLNLYNSDWTEIGIGMPGSVFRPLLPFTFFEKFVFGLGLPLVKFQECIFVILIAIGMISSFYLCKELLKDEIKGTNLEMASFIGGLFYLFNPISMLGVWYRFIYTFMFLYALVPLVFLLFLIGIKNNNLKFGLIIPLITLPFCYAFGSPAMVPLLWILPGLYTLILFIYGKKNLKRFSVLLLSISIFFWILVNLWWIIPMKDFLTGFASTSSANGLEFNINDLKSNSQDFTLDNIIRLIHGGFLYRGLAFGSVYLSKPFIFLSWILPLIAIIGFINVRDKVLKKFLLFAFILLFFLTKGNSWPFGNIQVFLFKIFPPMQLYRNPLEKWGLVLPTVYMIVFAMGLTSLLLSNLGKKSKLLILLAAMTYLFVFHWPIVTGGIVGFGDRQIEVEVPPSFEQANKVIGSSHRLLSIPITGGASGIYTWNKPFAGHDASEYLFDSSSIAKAFGGDNYSKLFVDLSQDNKVNLDTKAQVFAADMVVLRKDLNLKRLDMQTDAISQSELKLQSSDLEKVIDYPEFSIWSLPSNKMISPISAFSKITFIDSVDSIIKILDENKINLKDSAYICNDKSCIPNVIPGDQNFENMTIPDRVEYKKISPTLYQVRVFGNKGKFILTLFQGYHPDWKVKVNDKDMPNIQHFVVNGFANGFLINQNESNFELEIYFSPKANYSLLNKISYITIAFLVGTVLGLPLTDLFFNRFKLNPV